MRPNPSRRLILGSAVTLAAASAAPILVGAFTSLTAAPAIQIQIPILILVLILIMAAALAASPARAGIPTDAACGPPTPELIRRAVKGEASAAREMAEIHDYGLGVTEDQEAASRWYRKAAEAGDVIGAYQLALRRSVGLGLPLDEWASMRWLETAAKAGHPKAMWRMGEIYDHGGLVPADLVSAHRWYRRSAKAGSPEGMFAMATLLSGDRWYRQDFPAAARWLYKSASRGFQPAFLAIRSALTGNSGLPPTPRQIENLDWLPETATDGEPAGLEMCRKILMGRGLEPDPRRMVAILEPLVIDGSVEASFLFGLATARGDGLGMSLGRALCYWDFSANRGFAPAKYAHFTYYSPDELYPLNESEGGRYLIQAADGGLPQAQRELGLVYLNGAGKVDTNRPLARLWLERALDGGAARAALDLGVSALIDLRMTFRTARVRAWLEESAVDETDLDLALCNQEYVDWVEFDDWLADRQKHSLD
jgi:TPR repeat protein